VVGALLAGESLADDAGILVDEDGHVRWVLFQVMEWAVADVC
jgi:hypothetical protein